MSNTKEAMTAKTEAVAPLAKRYFTGEGEHPFDRITWSTRRVKVNGPNGAVERDLEFPDFWSDAACKIAGSKYFRGRIGTAEWETSAKQMIGRVASTLRRWGLEFGYFDSEAEADSFADELSYILVNQRAAFNSPVWFNMGIDKKPQCSACFILAVEDNMDSM